MKKESLGHEFYKNIDELKVADDEYVNFFNNKRSFKKFGILSPEQDENKYYVEIDGYTYIPDDSIPY